MDWMAQKGALRGYFQGSRDLFTSLVLVMPLFFAYQIGVLMTGGLRNGVDFVTTFLFIAFDGNILAYLGFNALVLLTFLVMLAKLRDKGHFHPRYLPWMLVESTVLALLFGTVVVALIRTIGLGELLAAGGGRPMGFIDKIVMSMGAGLYEELVFRLFLMGGMFWALTKPLGMGRVPAALLAVVASSIIFSAAHHLAEPFTISAFTFRIFAGVLFAVIFHVRGFAIAAYTHAFYDVWVMVFKNA
jgi:membrane protease YdiL (CAAX protease family)